MTEKVDDSISESSSTSQLHAVVDPPKTTIVNDPVPRTILNGTPPVPQSTTTTTVDVTPPVKEGYNYWSHLPYPVEDEAVRISRLNDIIGDLYICVRAGDFEAGARTASRQIKRWLHLKFKMPK